MSEIKIQKREPYWDYMLRRLKGERKNQMSVNNQVRSIWITFKKEGIHYHDIETRRSSLEDIFVNLVKTT